MKRTIVNVGLERQRPRKPGAKIQWESKNVVGEVFYGNWGREADHRLFRQAVQARNPGWTVKGYAKVG